MGRRVFLLLLLILALLVCDAAAGLASGLARGLALAAAAVFSTVAKIAGLDSLDMFHYSILRMNYITIISCFAQQVKGKIKIK